MGYDTNKIQITPSKDFTFDFKTSGNSIFDNLIINVKGYKNKTNSELKLQCNWRRSKNDTTIFINDKSTTYIPTAEDIGYKVEVEVYVQNEPSFEPAKAQIGPFVLDNNIKAHLEKLIINDSKTFEMFLFNSETQSLINDRKILLKIEGDNLKIYEENRKMNEYVLIENAKITNENPKIKLHPYQAKRFYLEFFQYTQANKIKVNHNPKEIEMDCVSSNSERDNEEASSLRINVSIKSKFHFETETKQTREIIYLLLQYCKMESKIKMNKILKNINIKEEYSCNLEDLLNEIKATQEENAILVTSGRIKSKEIENLKREMKNLEEDFMFSLKNISSNITNNETYPFQEKNNLISSSNLLINELRDNDINEGKSTKVSTISPLEVEGIEYAVHEEMRKKFDKLREDFSKVSTREKGLTEKNQSLILQSEVLRNELEDLKQINRQLINKQVLTENDLLESLKHKNAFEKNFIDFKNEIAYLKEENLQLYKIKEEYEKIKFQIPFQSSISSKENFSNFEASKMNQKKELERLSLKNQNYESELSLMKKEYEILKEESNKKEEAVEEKKKKLEDLKTELNELKIKNFEMEKEKTTVKENFRSLFSKTYKANKNMGDNCIKITVDEYDEFESLRRGRDELDAQIMKLKSNGEAKDVLIKSLQKQLEEQYKKTK